MDLAHTFIPTHQMVKLCKNPSGNLIVLSKYHHQNLSSTNKLAIRRERSPTNTTSLSNLDPTSSLISPVSGLRHNIT